MNQNFKPKGKKRFPARKPEPQEEEAPEFIDKLVKINRVAKVVKGGRRFRFIALMVSGDGKGRVGFGTGKAKEVPEAIRKATEAAHKNMTSYAMKGTTVPHQVIGKHDGGRVLLRPASEGTGVVAGPGVRDILGAMGITNILSKSQGSNNVYAVLRATLDALSQLRTAEQIKALRSAS
jgi:small subunit ribosomal protein S5